MTNRLKELLRVAARVEKPAQLAAFCAVLIVGLLLETVSVFLNIENVVIAAVVASTLIVAMACVTIIALGAIKQAVSSTDTTNMQEMPHQLGAYRGLSELQHNSLRRYVDIPNDLRVEVDILSKISKALKILGFRTDHCRTMHTLWATSFYSIAEKENLKIAVISLPPGLFLDNYLWDMTRWYNRLIGVMEKNLTHIAIFSSVDSVPSAAIVEADGIMNSENIHIEVFTRKHIEHFAKLDDETLAKVIKSTLSLA